MFSFDPVKTITCIDGGAIVVRGKEEMSRLHEMRLIGMISRLKSCTATPGLGLTTSKASGSAITCRTCTLRIGLAQLSRIDEMGRVGESLADCITPPSTPYPR